MVAILPGSRTQELVRNLPEMVRAANETGPASVPTSASPSPACTSATRRWPSKSSRSAIALEGMSPGLVMEVHAGRTPELIRLARVAWAVSGSVGLELMVEALPSVVLYKVKRFDLWVARRFIKSKYISLVNLLADAEVFPEYLTWRDVSDDLVRWALAWLDESPERGPGDRVPGRVTAPGGPARRLGPRRRTHRQLVNHRKGTPGPMGNPPLSSYRGPHELGNQHERADQSSPRLH